MADVTRAVVPAAAGEEQAIDRATRVTRRHVLTAMGALAAVGGFPLAAAAEAVKGHVHGTNAGKTGDSFSAAAADCVTVGNACLAQPSGCTYLTVHIKFICRVITSYTDIVR